MISWHPTPTGFALVDESDGTLRILGKVERKLGLWHASYLGEPVGTYPSAEQARWAVDLRLVEENASKGKEAT